MHNTNASLAIMRVGRFYVDVYNDTNYNITNEGGSLAMDEVREQAFEEIMKKIMAEKMEELFKKAMSEGMEVAMKQIVSEGMEEVAQKTLDAKKRVEGKRKNKRRNGEGSFYVRKDGLHSLRIMVGRKDNGKPDYKWFYGQTDAECIQKHEDYKAKIRAGLDLNKRYKFGEFGDLWLDQHSTEIEPSTQDGYGYTLRVLKEYFGKMYIDEIKAEKITNFLKEYRETYSDSSRAKCRAMLFQIFKYAVANDLLLKNPVKYVEKLKSKEKGKKKKEKGAFTAEEVMLLLEKLPRDDKYAHGAILMLGTGMRGQELLALEPAHISEDGKEVLVEQAVKLAKGRVYLGGPKSSQSYRCVPVAEFARESAKILRDTDDKFIFNGRFKDKPCCPSTFADHFKTHIEKVGVKVLTPHCCRHTYVSLMQEIGVDMETIRDIIGHEDIDMTRHYLHVQKSIRENAAERLSAQFQGVVAKPVQ